MQSMTPVHSDNSVTPRPTNYNAPILFNHTCTTAMSNRATMRTMHGFGNTWHHPRDNTTHYAEGHTAPIRFYQQAGAQTWRAQSVMLRLYIQHTATHQVGPFLSPSKTGGTLLDSHHIVACPHHLLCDICYMLHHVD